MTIATVLSICSLLASAYAFGVLFAVRSVHRPVRRPNVQRYRLVEGMGLQPHPDGAYVRYADLHRHELGDH